MAESETRLETLEDEVKVLKGEVKRTLVDLRALLMQEDSPLSDGALARRAAMSEQGTDNEINEIPRAGTTRVAAPPLADLTNGEGTGASPSGNAGPPFGDGRAEAAAVPPTDGPPGGPPQPGPGPAPIPRVVPGASPGSQADQHPNTGHGQTSPGNEGGEGPLGQSNHHGELPVNEGPPAEEAGPAHRSQARNGHERLNSRENSPEAENAGHNGSVYDEYRELLEETRQTHPIEDSPDGPPLDINLLSNLVYWTARAKQRVGEAQLRDILQLYIQTGHSRPEFQDLMLQISAMVDADSVYPSENPREREWVELMFHLHGILTGGFPVTKLPNIRPWARDDARGDRG